MSGLDSRPVQVPDPAELEARERRSWMRRGLDGKLHLLALPARSARADYVEQIIGCVLPATGLRGSALEVRVVEVGWVSSLGVLEFDDRTLRRLMSRLRYDDGRYCACATFIPDVNEPQILVCPSCQAVAFWLNHEATGNIPAPSLFDHDGLYGGPEDGEGTPPDGGSAVEVLPDGTPAQHHVVPGDWSSAPRDEDDQ